MLRLVETEIEGEMLPTLDELAREGARRMLQSALEAEVASYLEAHHDARDEKGHALVVRNGRARERQVTLGSGTVAGALRCVLSAPKSPRVPQRLGELSRCPRTFTIVAHVSASPDLPKGDGYSDCARGRACYWSAQASGGRNVAIFRPAEDRWAVAMERCGGELVSALGSANGPGGLRSRPSRENRAHGQIQGANKA